jgi:hypothetical protein
MRAPWLALASVAALCLASPAQAHGMRTAFVEITETAPGAAVVSVRLPVETEEVALVPPDSCTTTELPSETERLRTLALACSGPLAGATVAVRGLGPQVSEAVVQVTLADGARATRVVTIASPAWTLPAERRPLAVFGDYARLGVVHIAAGVDHLLFLSLIVLILRRWRGVLLAETAFTVSHALSFTATALGWVHVSAAAAEACIAASLILLALDVGKEARVRAVVGTAFVFGVVHGLGFAGGLLEIGLPERDVASALLGFAGGVEAGQVAFVLFLLACVAIADRVRALTLALRAAPLVIGGISSFWFLQRLVLVVRP